MSKIKQELEEIFKVNESQYQYYIDLCKRKYHGLPEQYKKCREAVMKRYQRR